MNNGDKVPLHTGLTEEAQRNFPGVSNERTAAVSGRVAVAFDFTSEGTAVS
jgi:hypothetical protein